MTKLPVRDNGPLPVVSPPAVPVVDAANEQLQQEEAFCKSQPPLLVQARRAFQRDLPRLLNECPKHWVAYRGDGQIASPDQSKARLFQQCVELGFQPGEFLLLPVSTESTSILSDVDL